MTPSARSVRRALRSAGLDAGLIAVTGYDDPTILPGADTLELWLDRPVRGVTIVVDVDELEGQARDDELEGRLEP